MSYHLQMGRVGEVGLGPEILAALDFSTLAKLPAEWVTEDFRRRHGDQVWRIRFKDAAHDVGAWLLLLLEFQSRDDPDMALRIPRLRGGAVP